MPTEASAHGISGPLRNAATDPTGGLEEPIILDDAALELCIPDPAAHQPEYPAARFVAASPANYLPWTACEPRPIARIVIHITDGRRRLDGPISHFQDPRAQVSAHYLIGQDGRVVQLVRHDDIAWHAHAANQDSIGIEHVARSPREFSHDDPGLPLTGAQYRASAALVRWLCQRYGLPLDRQHIQGHAEADPQTTHSDCPNRIWDWRGFMALLAQADAGAHHR